MSEPLATRAKLAQRVGPIVEPEDVALADFMLEFASEQVRTYGRSEWVLPTCPKIVQLVVVEAASRGYNNAEGYKLERGDELTLQRDEISAAGCVLTKPEISLVRQASYRNGVTSLILLRPDQLSDQDSRGGAGGGGGGSITAY